jgi:asparagine synthase (glutamine-hydrolysing)
MCGIAGAAGSIERDRAVVAVGLINDRQVHRGPDDSGLEAHLGIGGQVVLAASRLAIQDLSAAGHMPMIDAETGNLIVLNGEIYNFRELRRELESRGARFTSHGDTEVVLKGYAAWGLDVISRLRGMFALALMDRHGDRLVLARDRLGVKPLYYSLDRGRLLFASELRALLSSGLVPAALSRSAVWGYLRLGAVQDPLTMIEGVLSLPAASLAVFSRNGLELQPYWSLADCFRNPAPELREAPRLVEQELRDAVSMRLISDAPIGVFLSGGLDSAAVTALAAESSEQPLRTVSVVFPEIKFSEKERIDLVSSRFSTDHTEVNLSESDLLADLPAALAAMDQPTFDGVNIYVVSRAARESGLTVALSGIGGDELFGGYPSFRRVPRLRKLAKAPSWSRLLAAGALARLRPDDDQMRKLRHYLREPGRPDLRPERLSRELFGLEEMAGLLPGVTAPLEVDRAAMSSPPNGDAFNAISYYELSQYTRNVLLRDTDVMSMANSLEVREPLLDHRLIELVASLPGAFKSYGAGPKPLLISAIGHLLPPELLGQPKMGFTLPFPVWLRGDLRLVVEETLLDARLGGQVAEMLDPEAVASVWHRYQRGLASWVRPWSLYVLKRWGEAWT